MWNLLILPMLLSTCILKVAISWVSKISSVENCGALPLNGGIFNWQFFFNKTSLIVKPLSAITLSFSSNKSIKPDDIVSSLSEVFPGQSSDTNDITPDGVIPTKNFTVVSQMVLVIWKSQTLVNKARRFLNINFCTINNDSNWRVSLLNEGGIVLWTISRDGKGLRHFNSCQSKQIHEEKYFEKVLSEIWKRSAISLVKSPTRSLISTANSWSIRSKDPADARLRSEDWSVFGPDQYFILSAFGRKIL